MSMLEDFAKDSRYNRKHYFHKNGQIREINPKEENLNRQGHLEDLSKKSRPELLDLLSRQEKLLENKKFISSLPDKGEKISRLITRIEVALKDIEATEAVRGLLSKLDINNKPSKQELEGFEWTQELKAEGGAEAVVEYDSDDEKREPDPFTVLASSTYDGHTVRTRVKEKPLIQPRDVEETKCDLSQDYASVLISKAENATSTVQFQPWRSLKHEGDKKDDVQKKPWWEITAATVPSYKFTGAKELSLQESMALEKEQVEKVKDLEMKRAVEKLTGASSSLKIGSYVPTREDTYRENNPQLNDSDDDDDHQEKLDDDVT